jgi:NADP-dependent 3-hydroxy acid dehydrogenase YdfG
MEQSIKEAGVLIPGGRTDIGNATALLFAKAGAKVMIAGRRLDRADKTEQKIKPNGAEGFFIPADV